MPRLRDDTKYLTLPLDDLFFMLLDKYATFCVTQMEV